MLSFVTDGWKYITMNWTIYRVPSGNPCCLHISWKKFHLSWSKNSGFQNFVIYLIKLLWSISNSPKIDLHPLVKRYKADVSQIKTVISTIVLVMEILNLDTIITQINFAIDNTNKTRNFQNISSDYMTEASTLP